MDNNLKVFYDNCCINLYTHEKETVTKLITELTLTSSIKLLSTDSVDLINKYYLKDETSGFYTLQIAMAKISATISGSKQLTNTYVKLVTDVHVFFKELKIIVSNTVYENYVTDNSIKLHIDFDKTFLVTMAYNYNLINKE